MLRPHASHLLIAVGAAGACHGQVRLFDMGPPGSPTWRGAEAVSEGTLYDPQRGFGWANAAGLTSAKRPIVDDLGGDFVSGGGTFVIDDGPGGHGVYVLLCDSGSGPDPPAFWSEPFAIRANGEEVAASAQGLDALFSEYYHANWAVDWEPSQSLFRKHFGKYDRAFEFAVTAPDGRIEIAFTPTCPVAAVAVWPGGSRSGATEAIAAIDEARRDRFDSGYAESPPPAGLRPGSYSAAARRRGYALWRRSIDDKVFPYTQPGPSDHARRVDLLAFPGETEAFSLCVRPLRSLSNATITASDLSGGGGHTIPAGSIHIARVKYVEKLVRPGEYVVEPRDLIPSGDDDLAAGVTRQYWITVHVPEEAAGRNYRGIVEFGAEERAPTRIRVRLRVPPVPLEPSPIAAGMIYYMPDAVDFRALRSRTLSLAMVGQMRAHLADMRAHGMTTVAVAPSGLIRREEGGRLVHDDAAWQRLDEFVRAYREAGFSGPIPAYQLAARLVAAAPSAPVLEGEGAGSPASPSRRSSARRTPRPSACSTSARAPTAGRRSSTTPPKT